MIDLIRNTINEFCQEFIQNPYICYTEHGLHAFFYSLLLQAVPESQRFLFWENQKICIIQKEYPTAGKLGKSQRQHWDIAVLKSPAESIRSGPGSYDYLKLNAVIEFGMNESEEHLKDDINRLCDEGSNIQHRFIVHLYRLSPAGHKFSGRDWTSTSQRISTLESVTAISQGRPVEIFYALSDSSEEFQSGLWRITNNY